MQTTKRTFSIHKKTVAGFLLLCSAHGSGWCETISLFFDNSIPQIAFAAGDIKVALQKKSHTVIEKKLIDLNREVTGRKIVLGLKNNDSVTSLLTEQKGSVSVAMKMV
jgi:hypothetical protein